MIRLGSSLILGKFGIVGPLADFIGVFLRGILGTIVETGIFQLDLTLDSLREGMKEKDFIKDATAAYEKATAKVYDEKTKNEIRKQYLDIISRFGNVGDSPL